MRLSAAKFDKAIKRPRHEQAWFGPQQDSSLWLNSTTTSLFISAGFANFPQVGTCPSFFSLQLHVDEFYF